MQKARYMAEPNLAGMRPSEAFYLATSGGARALGKSAAIGTLDVTRFAPGYQNELGIEVNGSQGSIRFRLERLEELDVYLEGDPPEVQGFRTVSTTQKVHPYRQHWWPAGHLIGALHVVNPAVQPHAFRRLVNGVLDTARLERDLSLGGNRGRNGLATQIRGLC